MAPFEAAGLYDADAPDAADRRALLEYLTGLGMSAGDIAEAARVGRLDRAAADHVLFEDAGPSLTAHDIADRTGLDEDSVRAVLRAAGAVDAVDACPYRDSYVALFAGYSVGVEIFGSDAILQFLRVLGSAAARVAEAAVGLFTQEVSPQLNASDVSELERVRRSADAVRAFQAVPPVMDILVREHFLTAIRRLGMLDVVEGGASAVTIAFVDLVASTRLAQRIPPSQLAAAFGEFERAATDAALARDCRVVKLIGDEVMIAGARAPDVLAVVAEVMAFADQHAVLTGARAGIASGYAIARDGDYFGPVVNVAARLAALAEGGDALVNDDAARVAASMGYATGDAEKRLLKGFDAPVAVTQVRLY